MTARNALLGLAMAALTVQAAQASSIPVVSAGRSSAPTTGAAIAPAPVVNPNVNTAVVTPVSTDSGVEQPAVLLNQLGALQREVMELRGLVEEQGNAIDRILKENRDRYLDLDRRISQLSGSAESASGTSMSAVPKNTAVSSSAGNISPDVAQAAAKKAGDVLYHDTFQLIRDRKFPEAVAGLKTYIERYPSGTYVDNAQYWLGEVYLAQGNLKTAKEAFALLLEKYPFSDKRADATYKLGQVYDRQGDRVKAKEYLQKAIKDFAGSSAARLADVYLRNLEG
ncbi:tol-pal system protein YbgF [Sansalvadorimonas verongulae]|uniref:tol-pal system protein YbgF n=1 Tax=Sansalvadorimonas verongulae TaxID=2172824 RepID=UPI0012BD1B4F|nr:tol-pal system protein YbgF [Sansalvadorimonas verongulae]MTI13750.1 tol-pal system protein YbgF [Sansalvadorimonas verongulae]